MGMGQTGQTIDVGRIAHGGRDRLPREIVDGAHRPPLVMAKPVRTETSAEGSTNCSHGKESEKPLVARTVASKSVVKRTETGTTTHSIRHSPWETVNDWF